MNPELQRVVVGLTEITPLLRQDALATFGEDVVLVLDSGAGKRLGCCNRLDDAPAYSGSDRVVTSDGNYCTTGFKAYIAVSPGVLHYGLLTAGHCWPNGTVVPQGYFDCNGVLHTFGNLGTVARHTFGNNVTDVEFLDATAIGQSVAANMWYGPELHPFGCSELSNSGPINVKGVGTSVVGNPVCFNGSVTGENCNAQIDAVNVCVTIRSITSCSQDRAHATNGSSLATGGDSGGPIEAGNGSGGVLVYGTISSVVGSEWYYSDATRELNAISAGIVTM